MANPSNEKLPTDILIEDLEADGIIKLTNGEISTYWPLNIVDYNDLSKNLETNLNLAYALKYNCQEEKSIEILFQMARQMIYWGHKETFLRMLGSYPEDSISTEASLRKLLFAIFSRIVPYYDADLSESELISYFDFLEQTWKEHPLIYLESCNLKGIFVRLYTKKVIQALELHADTLKRIDMSLGKEAIQIKSKILLNMALCYQQNGELQKALDCWQRAEEWSKGIVDKHEEAKLYTIKAMLLFNKESRIESLDIKDITGTLQNLADITTNFDFPDVDRTYYNILGDIHVKINNDYKSYFALKNKVFNCDGALYFENFQEDFFRMLADILVFVQQRKNEVLDSLDILIKGFLEMGLEDESKFIAGIKRCLLGKTKPPKCDIKNETLKIIYYEFTKRLIEKSQ